MYQNDIYTSFPYKAVVFTYNSNKTLSPSGTSTTLGPRLERSVESPDVDTRQSEPGQRKLSSGAVILEFDIKVEISGVKEKQGAFADGALFGFDLGTEQRRSGEECVQPG